MVKRIDVLLAAYNGAPWLEEQLDSLAAQEDGCFRVLLQDDGSTDGTVALLRARCARDERFVPASAQGEHLGAIGNFLSLLRQTDAPYCALCDQDDRWLPTRLSACRAAMEAAERRYGADTPLLVHSDARVTDARGQVLHDSFFAHQGWDAGAVELRRLLVQNNVTGCTTLLNAPLRRLVCERAEAGRLYMHDWFIALTAASFGQVVFVNEPLVCYRQHGTNVMGASAGGEVSRGVRMLGTLRKGRERMRLTYTHTRTFRDIWGDDLPEEARRVIDGYLATERMGKPRRLLAVWRGGYTMQSRVTRLGQLLLG